MFMDNRALFWSEIMNWASVLREMESDFGILPYPKFNKQQENYISSTGTPHVMCIPITTSDTSRTGIVLEALCAESRKSTKVHFYDTMLKSKIIGRDEESGEMLDIIFSNRMYEIGRMYWDSIIAAPVSALMKDNKKDIVSLVEKNETSIQDTIQKAIDAFESAN